MAPGAGARRQDDEAEHSAPDYLRRVQPDWTEGLESSSGAIGADLVPDADSVSTAPAAAVNPEPAPPVTFTGVGPMDSNPDEPADRTNR